MYLQDFFSANNKEEKRQIFWFILSSFIMFGIHFAPTISGLKPQGQSMLAIFIWFMMITITGSLNNVTIGVGTPFLIVLLTGAEIPQAFVAFSSNIFFLTFGTFVFAAVITTTPLGKRIALTLTGLFRSNKIKNIFIGLTCGDLAINTFLPSVAETGLLLPIVKSIQQLTEGQKGEEVDRVNKSLMILICGLIPLLTGLLLLTAHLPNVLLAGFLEEAGYRISFVNWFIYNLPLWGTLPIAIWFTIRFYKLKGADIPEADVVIPRMRKELGPMTISEKWSLLSVSICFVLWITEGSLHNLSTGMVALLLIVLLFLPFGKLHFKEILPNIMWETWILLGGAISLGTNLSKFGTVSWLINIIMAPIKNNLLGLPAIVILIIVVFALHIPRAGIVSAGAMGAMFIPIVIDLAHILHFNVVPFSLIVTNCLSYAFFIPMSITSFFIAWGASGASMKEILKFGVPISCILNLYAIIILSIWLPIVNVPLR